jgi:HAD superfamily hydrolase (TIGR01549 family)
MDRRAVLFDVEGTLVDCVQETLACWRATLYVFGFDFSIPELHRHSGRDPDDMIRALLSASDADRLAPTLKEEQGKRYRTEYLAKVKAFPGVRELLELLRKNEYLIALATSCAKDELRHYVTLLDITGLIDVVACGEDVSREKPHPDLIKLALARAKSPAHAVMVGDTPFDAQAAKAAGIGAIGMLSGGFSEDHLSKAGCDVVYRDPVSLLNNFSDSVFIRWQARLM